MASACTAAAASRNCFVIRSRATVLRIGRSPFETRDNSKCRRAVRRETRAGACTWGRAERRHAGKRPGCVEGWSTPGEAEAVRNGQTVERAESAARHAHL